MDLLTHSNYTKGVKWHDGEDFTSADVKFTYEKIMESEGFLASALSAVDSIGMPG